MIRSQLLKTQGTNIVNPCEPFPGSQQRHCGQSSCISLSMGGGVASVGGWGEGAWWQGGLLAYQLQDGGYSPRRVREVLYLIQL